MFAFLLGQAIVNSSSGFWLATTSAGLGVVGITVAGMYFVSRRRRLQLQPRASTALSRHSREDAGPIAPPEERRRSPRPWGPPIEVQIGSGMAAAPEWRGWVVNRSLGGVCFSSAESLPTGTLLNLRATIAPQTVPWAQVVVRHCEFKVNRWLVGGEFVEAIPVEVLRLFGYR